MDLPLNQHGVPQYPAYGGPGQRFYPTPAEYAAEAQRMATYGLNPNNPILRDPRMFPDTYASPTGETYADTNWQTNLSYMPQMNMNEVALRAAQNSAAKVFNSPLRGLAVPGSQHLPNIPQRPSIDPGLLLRGALSNYQFGY